MEKGRNEGRKGKKKGNMKEDKIGKERKIAGRKKIKTSHIHIL